MTLTKMHGVLGLFVLLVIILMVKPIFYNNMYKNVLGRVVLIAILLFFATNSVTLGLLVALIIIIGTNISFVEGMNNNTSSDMPSDNIHHGSSNNQVNNQTTSAESNDKSNDQSNDLSNSQSGVKGKNDNDAISKAISQLGGNGVTIGDDSQSISTNIAPIQVTTSNYKKNNKGNGVDRITLAETMMSMDSNIMPIDKDVFKGGDVEAAEPSICKEGYMSLFH
jgi:hypothetical protein